MEDGTIRRQGRDTVRTVPRQIIAHISHDIIAHDQVSGVSGNECGNRV
jgi:hypothetical protein